MKSNLTICSKETVYKLIWGLVLFLKPLVIVMFQAIQRPISEFPLKSSWSVLILQKEKKNVLPPFLEELNNEPNQKKPFIVHSTSVPLIVKPITPVNSNLFCTMSVVKLLMQNTYRPLSFSKSASSFRLYNIIYNYYNLFKLDNLKCWAVIFPWD